MVEYILSRPFIALFCTTALGIICFANLFESSISVLFLFFLASISALIILWKYKVHTIYFLIFTFLFSFGLQYMHQKRHHANLETDKINNLNKGTFIILESEMIRNQLQANARLVGFTKNCKFKLHFTDSASLPKLYYGDTLLCNFTLNNVKPGLSRSFSNYNNFLLNQHIYFKAWVTDSSMLLKRYSGLSILNKAQQISQFAKNILHKAVNDSLVAQLLIALVIGDKADLNKNLKTDFISSGTAHILAVSGLHLGMIYALIVAIISPILSRYRHTRNARFFQSTLILILIWNFTIISGLSTSAIRASVMLTFLETGKLLKRPIDSINSLFSCGFFMLIQNPCTLWDIGFQLSITAVLGIILLKPFVNRIYSFANKTITNFIDLITISLCAQIFVAPLLIYHFHQFPIYFLLANIVWIPLSFILLIAAVIILVFYSVIPPIASMLSSICILICKPGFLTFDLLRKYPVDGFDNLWIYPEQIIFFYASMLLLYFWLKYPNKKYLFLSIGMFFLIPASFIIRYNILFNKKELILFTEKHIIHLAVKSENQLHTTIPESVVLNNYLAENRISKVEFIHRDTLYKKLKTLVRIDHCFIDNNKSKYFLSNAYPRTLNLTYKEDKKDSVDYLILNHHKALDNLCINKHPMQHYKQHILNSDGPLILKL